jgi:hypothetical protein
MTVTDELRAAIRVLQMQGGDESRAQTAFAEIADMAHRESGCAAELSRAVLEEAAAGALRTPRLVTLLGLTREPVPECIHVCLDLVRTLVRTPSALPTDATLGAAAIIARIRPRELIPDLATLQSSSQAEPDIDRDRLVAQALTQLLAISRHFLRELPDHAVTGMARWLWHDCAMLDLMTLMDFVGLEVKAWGANDAIVELMADLIERVPATGDQKRYAGQVLQTAGVGTAIAEHLQAAWRAICVAPATDGSGEPPTIADPEPPPPEPRVDKWLVVFAGGTASEVELARIHIEQMLEQATSPAALTWWLAVTVDALQPRRRRTDLDWALVRSATALRRHGPQTGAMPPSLLRRWLDTPQLLSAIGTKVALDMLSRQQPSVIVDRYLHRAVAASTEDRHARISMGELWRTLAATEPAAVLIVASRWLAFGFGLSSFLDLLIEVLMERARAHPDLIESLSGALGPTPGTPDSVVGVARDLLDELRQHSGQVDSHE